MLRNKMPCVCRGRVQKRPWIIRDSRYRGFYSEMNQQMLGEGGHPAKQFSK